MVNNAGVSYDYPEFFHLVENNEVIFHSDKINFWFFLNRVLYNKDLFKSKFDSILNVNCASMVQLSAAVLEQMNNRNKGYFSIVYNFKSIYQKYFYK